MRLVVLLFLVNRYRNHGSNENDVHYHTLTSHIFPWLQDEAELLAELERIRQERAEEASRTAAQRMQEEEMKVREEVCAGNPLLEKKLSSKADFTIKRKWDDDVVFKNQSSKEPVQQRRFINDTIRNDFHRRFLDRYMK